MYYAINDLVFDLSRVIAAGIKPADPFVHGPLVKFIMTLALDGYDGEVSVTFTTRDEAKDELDSLHRALNNAYPDL